MELTPKQLKQLRESPIGKIGNRLARAIELAETSNVDVARATGFTQQYVSDVSRGRYDDISVGNARKFARLFGCAIEDVFPARAVVSAR